MQQAGFAVLRRRDRDRRQLAVRADVAVGDRLHLRSRVVSAHRDVHLQGRGLGADARRHAADHERRDRRTSASSTRRRGRRSRGSRCATAGSRSSELNELEYVKGEVLANVWQTDRIARISPKTGQVLGWIDLVGTADPARSRSRRLRRAERHRLRRAGRSPVRDRQAVAEAVRNQGPVFAAAGRARSKDRRRLVSVRFSDSRAMRSTIGFATGRTSIGTDRLRLTDSHSTITPPATAS